MTSERTREYCPSSGSSEGSVFLNDTVRPCESVNLHAVRELFYFTHIMLIHLTSACDFRAQSSIARSKCKQPKW